MNFLTDFFSTDGFMPHGHCYLWQPGLVWTMVASDAVIGLSYVVISAALYLLFRRSKVPFEMVFLAFGAFILACGMTHFMEIYNLWVPSYWLAAGIKVVTATASVVTAVYVIKLFPKIFEIVAAAKELAHSRSKVEDAFFRKIATPPQIQGMLRRIVTIPMISVVGLIVISIFQAAYLRTYQNRVDHSTEVILRAQRMKSIAVESENSLQSLWLSHTRENAAQSMASEKKFDEMYGELKAVVPEGTEQYEHLTSIRKAYDDWRTFKKASEAEAARSSLTSLDVLSFYRTMSKHSRPVMNAFETFIWGERSLRTAQGETTHLLANGLIISVCLISLLIGVIFAFFGRNAIFQVSSSYARVLESEKITQEKLRNAVSARDEFFSMASHELKTPITSLKLQLQMLERGMQPESKRQPTTEQLLQSFELALRQVNTLNDLVEDMLDTSRIQTGNFILSRSEVNLSDLVTDIVTRLRAQLKSAGIPVTKDLQAHLVGHWDRHRLEQVVVNLLTNAIRYAPGTPIKITTATDEFGARLTVKDSGPGIEMEKQERIFDRFERANSTNKAGGLGLGLFIVRKIVEAHGGMVTVDSRPGEGATFIVRLPLEKGHQIGLPKRGLDASV